MFRYVGLFLTMFLVHTSLLAWDFASLASRFTVKELENPEAAPTGSFSGIEKEMTSLKDYRGKVVLINFWATWCGPCRRDMVALEKLYTQYEKQGLAILTFSQDKSEDRDKVLKFKSDLGLTSLPIFQDTGGIFNRLVTQYGIGGQMSLPLSILIDKNGKIVAYIQGSRDYASEDAKALVEYYLSKNENE